MKSIVLCFAILGLVPASSVAQERLDMVVANDRFLLIKGVFCDTIEARLLFDTGGGLEVVSGRLFERIGDTAVPRGIITAFRSTGHRVDLELFTIPSLQVGSLKKHNITVSPFLELDSYHEILDGILSLKFFEDQPVTIDFPAGQLVLETSGSLETIAQQAESVPIYLQSDRDIGLSAFIPLTVNGRLRILAEFDTGTGVEYMMSPYFLEALGIDTTNVQRGDFPYKDGTAQRMYIAPVASIGLENRPTVAVRDVPVTFLQEFIHEGLIGWQMFRDRRVTIDLAHGRLFVW